MELQREEYVTPNKTEKMDRFATFHKNNWSRNAQDFIWHVRQKKTLQSRFSDEKCEKEEKSLQVRRWEESKKPQDWICGAGDNSPVRAEGDSHNYKFLPLQFFIMLWEHISVKCFRNYHHIRQENCQRKRPKNLHTSIVNSN